MFSRKLRLIIDLKLNGMEDKETIYSADEIGKHTLRKMVRQFKSRALESI